MTQPCRIALRAPAIPASLEDLGSAALDVFFALGIVNPAGPTLTFVAAVGHQEPGADLPLVKVMLNPFTQRVEQVGRFHVGQTWCPREDFPALFGLGFGDCPTLVLVNQGVPEADREPLVAELLARFGAAQGLAALVLDPRHVAQELNAFLAAWHGSIEMTGIPDALKLRALGYGRFKAMLFDRVLPSVWLPEAPTQAPPAAAAPRRLRIDSLDHLHALLEQRQWEDFDEQMAMDLLRPH